MHLADLKRIWERESGRNLEWFFEQWFARSGAPEFRMNYATTSQRGGTFGVNGTVVQTGDLYRVSADIVLAVAGRAPRVEHLAISGREMPFHFVSDSKPDTVLFDPDYKILRWTDSYRNVGLLDEAMHKHSTGEVDSADSCLGEYLSRAPMSLVGHSTRGRWSLDSGKLDAAERDFQWALDRIRPYDPDDPAVTRCEVGLGQVADLRGRRDEAIAWYRKAVARDDGSTAMQNAIEYLKIPFRATPTSAGADPAFLKRCAGTYATPQGLSIVVSVGKSGFLTALVPGEQPFGLRLEEGTRFRAVADEPVTLQFEGGGAAFQEVTIESSGRTFRLQRKN
jgi:tetratricopeptide (TPR) repeat protein